jgi:hypothetical protein
MRRETLLEVLELANTGSFRTPEEARLWAADYIQNGGTDNFEAAVAAANVREAERATQKAVKAIDAKRCIILRKKLYFETEELAGALCRQNPSQLADLEEKATQLDCEAVCIKAGRLKNASERYSDIEAEAIARQELGLPKIKVAAASVPDLFGKSRREIAKIAADMEPEKRSKIPDMFGKSRKEIAEEVEKL